MGRHTGTCSCASPWKWMGIVENDLPRVAGGDAPMRIQYYRLNFCLNPRENARFRFSARGTSARNGVREPPAGDWPPEGCCDGWLPRSSLFTARLARLKTARPVASLDTKSVLSSDTDWCKTPLWCGGIIASV